MGDRKTTIVLMKRGQIKACSAIAAQSEPWKTLGETIDFFAYVKKKQAFVCLVGGAPAGFVVFTSEPVFARGGYLRAIGVAPAMRRQGIGKALMAFAEKTAARQSANFYLCVSSFNRKAHAFYRSLGYAKVGALPGLITPKAAEYIYWKRLSPASHHSRRR